MPKPGTLEKATLTEMWPGSDNTLKEQGQGGGKAKRVAVQFNPQTLKLSLSNQNAGGSQPGGSSTQFVGQGTTKLSLELWFDAALPVPSGAEDPQGDVRNLTKEIAYFMSPQEVTRGGKKGLVPPGVQFQWGTFLFKGTMDSLEETLEFFSEDGKPLRAGMQLSLSKQDLKFEFGSAGAGASGGGPGGPGALPGAPGGAPAAGTQPLQMARAGDTVQAASARAGVSNWKAVAAANGIENPRLVPPGALLNVSGAGGRGSASLGLSGGRATTTAGSPTGTSITVAGSGSGSSGLPASASLRFTGPSGASR